MGTGLFEDILPEIIKREETFSFDKLSQLLPF